MAVERFRTASSRADLIFCDANFLWDFAIFGIPSLQAKASPPRIQRASDASAFYLRYRSTHNAVFISSPYVLEELCHGLAMQVFQTTTVTLGPKPSSWKEFKRLHPTAFLAARSAVLTLIDELWAHLGNYDLEFVVPRIGAGIKRRTVVHTEVAETALNLHKAHDELDYMDAFHIAMALASGARWIATSDRAFTSVPEISVFTG